MTSPSFPLLLSPFSSELVCIAGATWRATGTSNAQMHTKHHAEADRASAWPNRQKMERPRGEGARRAAAYRQEIIISEQTVWEDTAGAFLFLFFLCLLTFEKNRKWTPDTVCAQAVSAENIKKTITLISHRSTASACTPPPLPVVNHRADNCIWAQIIITCLFFPSAAPLTGFNQRWPFFFSQHSLSFFFFFFIFFSKYTKLPETDNGRDYERGRGNNDPSRENRAANCKASRRSRGAECQEWKVTPARFAELMEQNCSDASNNCGACWGKGEDFIWRNLADSYLPFKKKAFVNLGNLEPF